MKRYFHATLALTLLISLSVSPICRALEDVTPTESNSVIAEPTPSSEVAQSPAAPAQTIVTLDPAPKVETPPPTQYHGTVITMVQTTGGTGRTDEELIELFNNSDADVDVTGWKITSAGTKLYEFSPENKGLGHYVILPAGKTVLLVTPAFLTAHAGFASDGTFTNSKIANASGSVQIVDAVGTFVSGLSWGMGTPSDGAPFAKSFSSGGVLERKVAADGIWYQDTRVNNDDFSTSTLRVQYSAGYLRDRYDACLNIDGISEIIPDGWLRNATDGTCAEQKKDPINTCEAIQFSEIAANTSHQFIELYNSSDIEQNLYGCMLMTNRSTSTKYMFTDEMIPAHGYMTVYVSDTPLLVTKTTTGIIYLLSSDGATEVDSVSYANLHVDTAWAKIDNQWLQTYLPTPGEENAVAIYPACDEGYERSQTTGRCNKVAVIVEPTPCKDGQYRSEETGRCRAIETVSTLKPCAEGQYRSEETNRCRSIVATVASALKPCADDQFRNPATGRCKLIASVDDLPKPCPEGQERNEATNRCRKISVQAMPEAAFPVEPIKDGAKAFVGWWAMGGILVLGAAYASWEWRDEIRHMVRRAATVVHRK